MNRSPFMLSSVLASLRATAILLLLLGGLWPAVITGLAQLAFPSAANGYYVMLRPLDPGTHTLNFGGVLPGMMQAITYTLHVE